VFKVSSSVAPVILTSLVYLSAIGSAHARQTTGGLGTTSAIFVPTTDKTTAEQKGSGYYFRVRIKGMRAAYFGGFWQKVKDLVVTSQVSIGGNPVTTIQHVRAIKKNNPDVMNANIDLIELTPASMVNAHIKVSFIAETSNKFQTLLQMLGGGTDTSTVASPLSLDPATAAVAAKVSTIASTLLSTLSDSSDSSTTDLLDMEEDLSPAVGDVRDGYYVMFASEDPKYPLPASLSANAIHVGDDGSIQVDNTDVSNLSYLVLEVDTLPVKTEQYGTGAWKSQLDTIDNDILGLANKQGESQQDYTTDYEKIEQAISNVGPLLNADPTYTKDDKTGILALRYTRLQKANPTAYTAYLASKTHVPVAAAAANQNNVLTPPAVTSITGAITLGELVNKASEYETKVNQNRSHIQDVLGSTAAP